MAKHHPNIPKGLKPFSGSDVKVVDELTLGQGVGLVRYCNTFDQIFYENQSRHTLSMYIQGGYQTHRMDGKHIYGAPGRFCLMPKNAYSSWRIGGRQQFVHLYFNDDYLKRLAMRVFEYDPRTVGLPELTFKEMPALEALVRHCILGLEWNPGNHMLMEQSVVTTLSHLIQSVGHRPLKQYKSGLTPGVKNRVLDYMHARFAHRISLAELAQVAGLSEYHFSRMFHISLAQTPHQYLQSLRIREVKQRLKSSPKHPLAEVALDCGFSSQSHMGRVFKKFTGMTPRQYAVNG